MIDLGKFNLLGVRINAIDYEASIAKILSAAHGGSAFGVSALAVHGVMTGVQDDEHRYRLNQLELVVPDGQPVRWALNWLHRTRLRDRVYGPNLMLMTCQAAASEGLPIFLFGGDQELLDRLESRLREQFPDLRIAGTLASKFRTLTPEEKREMIATIRSSGAAITMVGLGCPRQEVWAYEFKQDLRMPVLAVGAAFNFHAGALPQAPGWMQRSGLEWLFRLIREPARLWYRYMILNPWFVVLFLLQLTGLRKFNPDSTVLPKKEILYG